MVHPFGFRRAALALVLAAASLGASAACAAPHPFNAHDLVMMDRVSDPHLSPDGAWTAYDLRTTDWEANKGEHSIWVADMAGRTEPVRLAASDGGATSPRWSADSRWIYFLSGRSGSDQVWRAAPTGGKAEQVTNLPLDVGAFRLSPDGWSLVVSMAVFPDCGTAECTKSRLDAIKAGKASGQLYDKLFVRHWDTWADGTRNHLFALMLGVDGKPRAAAIPLMGDFDGDTPTKPFGGDEDFVYTPDGSAVIFSARQAGRSEPWSTNFDLYKVKVDGSAPPQDLTAANPAWDAQPVVSPDGKWLAYRAQKRPGFESDRFGVWIMDLAGGARHELAPGWDRSADHIAWSADGRTLYATAEDVGQTRLFAIDAASGAVKPVTGAGHVTDFDPGKGGVVYAQDALDAPAQLYRLAAEPQQLTHHNTERLAEIGFGGYEQFSFPGWNGETVHGYLVKPVGFKPGVKYPVAFLIHGGPQGSFGNLFHYRWNAQTYAGAGFAVVMIDFHGSTGYGQAFTDAISTHWGDRPLEDLQKGWAYALAQYPFLDGKRACALGGSYGGYMVNWMAGVWKQPWKCLVTHDGVFDNRMMGYATEELWFSEWENGGVPWGNAEGYERFNPVNRVADWSTPQLIIHGGKDYRIPLEQGLGAFDALQRKGVPSQFLFFPDENHWVLKPRNSVQWHETVEAWLKRWTGPS